MFKVNAVFNCIQFCRKVHNYNNCIIYIDQIYILILSLTGIRSTVITRV